MLKTVSQCDSQPNFAQYIVLVFFLLWMCWPIIMPRKRERASVWNADTFECFFYSFGIRVQKWEIWTSVMECNWRSGVPSNPMQIGESYQPLALWFLLLLAIEEFPVLCIVMNGQSDKWHGSNGKKVWKLSKSYAGWLSICFLKMFMTPSFIQIGCLSFRLCYPVSVPVSRSMLATARKTLRCTSAYASTKTRVIAPLSWTARRTTLG